MRYGSLYEKCRNPKELSAGLQPPPAEFWCAGLRAMMASAAVINDEKVDDGLVDYFEKKALKSMYLPGIGGTV
jgi:hypothetical protein